MVLGRLQPHQWDDAAALIHAALSDFYLRHFNDDRFGTAAAPFRCFPELYESLDPGFCLTLTDAGELLGLLFLHPRETHYGIGIVATLPRVGARGVGKMLVKEALRLAGEAGVPARLVSSAQNLQSFSLYTKLGFCPQQTFQDLLLDVPTEGLVQSVPVEPGVHIRRAVAADVPGIVGLEFRLNGLKRAKDYLHFLQQPEQGWHLWVAEVAGEIVGFLGGIRHPGITMLGPGVSVDAGSMASLIHGLLNAEFRGKSVLWLIPVDATLLVQQAYAWGAKNVELHLTSVCGAAAPLTGVTLPSFMPESG